MAYSDGNSVALTPDYGFNIASPTGIETDGYPVTLAIAVKPSTATGASDALIGIARSGGNHWVRIKVTSSITAINTTATITISTRAGAGGTEVTDETTAVITDDTWSIIVVKFTSTTDRKIVIDSNSLESFTTTGASPSSLDTLYLANMRGSEYLGGSIAWGAAWWSALADADMQAIAAGTDAPNDHTPDELIYFESTTAIEGQNGSTVNQTGAGSIAEDGTDPTGWPPAGGGVVTGRGRLIGGKLVGGILVRQM